MKYFCTSEAISCDQCGFRESRVSTVIKMVHVDLKKAQDDLFELEMQIQTKKV
jgi:hypothetical protein